PQQIEFSRLNLTYAVMSKRILNQLVEEGHVDGWDDPRMSTIRGLRRRGYTPESIRDFCRRIGVTKSDNNVEFEALENCAREDLGHRCQRALGVLRPLKVTIENYPEGQVEYFEALNHPQRPELGTRQVPFSRVLYIEADDFMEDPPKKFFRLGPGREVRLRFAYYVTCIDYRKDPQTGAVVELICRYDPQSRGGETPDGRKVKGTIHWVSAAHAVDAQVRLYDRLFQVPNPGAARQEKPLAELLNPQSLEVLEHCKLEPMLAEVEPGATYQFERLGYFCADPSSTTGRPVFNRTVTLRDTWAKIAAR
ncbi:MAG: glutamine--tRNA ligase, partial [Gammaproteobacteria bacterium]|nr:glutamine--tRNA ligase [Gammaproteobacteria bacterium]